MASCVAVLSSTINKPIFIASSSNETLGDQYTLHTSLDVIEEKTRHSLGSTLSSPSGGPVKKSSAAELNRDLYLGSLYTTEKKKVFGYVTNTRIKFVIIVDSANTTLRDNEIRQMFRKLHTAYIQLNFNPFYVPGEKITSKRFKEVVNGLLQQKK